MTPAQYGQMGYDVFPCRGKRPARSATWPNDIPFRSGDNVGLAVPVGAVVIDLDVEENIDGIAEFTKIAPGDFLHDGPKAKTGGGGYHLWFRAPDVLGIGNSSGSLPEGIHVRGGGKGYVIAPPSVHPDTNKLYEWIRPLKPVAELPLIPSWLVDIILQPKKYKSLATSFSEPTRGESIPYVEAALKSACDTVRNATPGERNNTLNTQAYKVAGYTASGLSIATIEAALLDAAMSISGPGFEERGIRATLNSALRSGVNQPRYAPAPSKRKPRSHDPGVKPSTQKSCFSDDKAGPRDRATVVIGTNERSVNDAAIAALAQANEGDIYTRSGELVRIVPNSGNRRVELPEDTITIRPLSAATLRERLAWSADWVKLDAKGEPKYIHPPAWATMAILDRGSYPGMHPIRGLAQYPMIRPDGSIAQASGYDQGTGYYLSSIPKNFDVAKECDRSDAEWSAEKLLEVLQDFPFRGDTDRAAWLAYLLTPLARAVIDGPTPLFLIEANVRGSGKTLLADAAGLILTGTTLPAQTYAANDEELEKIIVAVARLGLPILCFDNISGPVGGPVMDKWLTSTCPTGRLLGSSDLLQFDWSTVIVATGNNARINGDTDRRSIYVTLETDHERPELRTDFAIVDLPAHLVEHRGEMLAHALTILRAHYQAGCPSGTGRAKGTFESWASRVRDAVMYAGLPDCERAPDDPSRPVDGDTDELGALLAAVWEAFGNTSWLVSDLLEMAYPTDRDYPTMGGKGLRDVLAQFDARKDKPSRQLIGRRLGKFRRRWLNGMQLISEVDGRTKQHIWHIAQRGEK